MAIGNLSFGEDSLSAVTPERVRREIVSRFNPIRGLTPDVLSARLDSFRVGYLRELALTFDAIEDRDINLKTVASKRKKAASRLQWDIVRVEGADETQAELHEAGLRYFYENLKATSVMESNQRGGVALLVRQMMDATGKRYACHEIVWKPVAKAMPVKSQDKAALANETPPSPRPDPSPCPLPVRGEGGAPERSAPRPDPSPCPLPVRGEGAAALANEAVVNPKLAIAQRRESPPSPRPSPPAPSGVAPGAATAGNSNSNSPVDGGDAPAEAGTPNGGTPSLQSLLTAEFRFCPLWFFENRTGRLKFIPTPFGVDGIPMPDGEWLVTVGDGIMEACAVAYIFKQMSLKDWVGFSEKFGMPGVIGKTDAPKDSTEWQAMSDAVSALMNDWAAVMNKNDAIELLETKGGAANLPFPPLVEYMDRKMAAIWRGADLSTISSGKEGTGASLQGDETDLLLEDDAQLITETLNQQVDTFVIEYLFGRGTVPLAFFKLGTGREEADDAKFRRDVFMKFLSDGTTIDMMANLTDLAELTRGVGLPPNEDYVEPYLPVTDEQGNPVTGDVRRDPEGDVVGGEAERSQRPEVGGRPSPNPLPGQGEGNALANGQPGQGEGNALANESFRTGTDDPQKLAAQLEENAYPDFVHAVTHDLRPIVERLSRILEIDDPDIRKTKLTDFLRELPRLQRDITADASAGKVLERTISAALLNGFSQRGPVAALTTERTQR